MSPDPDSNPNAVKSGADHDKHFSTDHLKADLRNRSVRGGAITVLSQAARFVLNLGSTIILARLLTPEDYGLVAMVATVSGFVALFKDMGLSMATIQQPEISHEQISTLFWANVVISVLLALILASLATIIARFYGEPQLIAMTIVMAAGMPLGGLTVQHRALLQRQMRFYTLAIIEFASLVTGVVTAIVLAALGASYWALVFMHLSTALTMVVASWAASGWRPGRPVRGSGARSMLVFGGHLTASNIANYLGQNVDSMLIGYLFGPTSLGLYNRAYSLLLLPQRQAIPALGSVARVALSRIADDPPRFRRGVLALVRCLALAASPLVAYVMATSDWLILMVLGDQWIEASAIFTWLAPLAWAWAISPIGVWAMTASGNTSTLLRWSVMNNLMAVVAIIVGLPFGPIGVASCYAVSGVVVRVPYQFWVVSRLGLIRYKDLMEIIVRNASLAAGLALVMIGCRQVLPPMHPSLGLLVYSGIVLAMYVPALLVLPFGRESVGELRDALAALTIRSGVR